MVAITWPPFTYTTFSILPCNLILEKYSLSLNVESDKFFLVLSWVSLTANVIAVITRMNLCYYTFANQQS
jgi:hypothetical protein